MRGFFIDALWVAQGDCAHVSALGVRRSAQNGAVRGGAKIVSQGTERAFVDGPAGLDQV